MIRELLGPDFDAVCKTGNPNYINEFKAILNEKLAKWYGTWTRTTTSKSSIIQAVNYLKIRAIPREEKFKVELTNFIAGLPC